MDTKKDVALAVAVGGLLFLLPLVAYLPAVSCGFVWDDDGYILHNQTLRTADGLRRIWLEFGATQDYYPLSFSTFWLEYQAWGLWAPGYHIDNVLLHAVNVVLLWRLLKRLRVPGAGAVAAIFAVHPVHVESVAWITERKNVLSGVFYLLSMHSFVRFYPLDEGASEPGRRWRHYFASLILFVCALLSKTVVVTLPFVLPVVIWWKRGRLRWLDGLLVVPYLALAGGLFLLVFSASANFGGAGVSIFGSARMGGAHWDYSLVERFLIAGRVIWFYAGKLVWPFGLCFVYPQWEIDPGDWRQYAVALAAVATPLVLALGGKRWGRGPLAAVLFFGLTLAPASGFFNFYFQRYSLVADHIQYAASAGIFILLVGAALRACDRVLPVPYRQTVSHALAATLVSALALLTWNQCRQYEDLETLWRETIRKNPESKLARTNLGSLLLERGETDEALHHYQAAYKLDPAMEAVNFNLGVIRARQGRYEEARAFFERTLRIDPKYLEAYNGLGVLLAGRGRWDEAIAQYEKALEIDDHYGPTHLNLATALHQMGRPTEAMMHYHRSLECDPWNAAAHYNLAVLLCETGRVEESVPHFEAVLRVSPDNPDAHYNLGAALMQMNRYSQAIPHLTATMALMPGDPVAHNLLGSALAELERYQEAEMHFREALRLAPGFEEAEENLREVVSQRGTSP